MSTSRVTSRRPLITWIAAAGTDATIIELCHDRACADRIGHAFSELPRATPVRDLDPGVVYFRVFGASGGVCTTGPSPVWSMIVPRVSAANETAWGTLPDFDGDGRGDLVVGAPVDGAGSVYVWYATNTDPMGSAPDETLTNEDPDCTIGGSVSAAGDVNGDGYGDLIVGAHSEVPHDCVDVYFGGPDGLSDTPQSIGGGNGFGTYVRGLGDFNGDGYGDVVIVTPGGMGSGTAAIRLGSASGVSAASFPVNASSVAGMVDDTFGFALAAGDFDGDRRADLVVSAYSDDAMSRGAVHYARWDGFGLQVVRIAEPDFPADAGERWAEQIAALDANGDGLCDLALTQTMQPLTQILFVGGSLEGLASPTAWNDNVPGTGMNFRPSLSGAGDVNGDGFEDLLVQIDDRAGLIFGANPPTVVTAIGAGCGACLFGSSLGMLGDRDGDTYDDVVAAAPGSPMNGGGWVRVYRGQPGLSVIEGAFIDRGLAGFGSGLTRR